MAADVLDVRARNRALLARQLLLEPARLPVLQVVEHLVGLQSQAPLAAYVGLWSRIDGFAADELSTLMDDRRVVRIALMRGTLHLVSAGDGRALRPLLQPVQDRATKTYERYLADVDLAELADRVRDLVETRPHTYAELGEALSEVWPGVRTEALTIAARTVVPLVQVTPRGVWGRTGPAAHTTLDDWLGARSRGSDTMTPDRLVTRYLAAFGPATVMDVQAWCGLTRLREVTDELGPQLRRFTDDAGRELLDLPDAPRPPGDTPAPPRLVAEFDNLLLSHAARDHVLDEDYRRVIFGRNAVIPGTVLVDGFVVGTWRISRGAAVAVVTVRLFEQVSAADRAAVELEARRLLSWTAPEAAHDVELRDGLPE